MVIEEIMRKMEGGKSTKIIASDREIFHMKRKVTDWAIRSYGSYNIGWLFAMQKVTLCKSLINRRFIVIIFDSVLTGFLYLVKHLECGIDCRLRLVGIKGTGAENAVLILPCDDCLHKGIGTTAGRNGDGIVEKVRQ